MLKRNICSHLSDLTEVRLSDAYVCEECTKTGDRWVHLRTCQTCGITLCCDSSPNTHATRHFLATGHPVIASAEPDERWVWCYVDEQIVAY
ncbi:UBP-type zinc finger domain-containing protein [Nibrella saemangeumensis]|uniref:UBP-type zinc finger domain-containing protein n=1 Tax=Nibrella saemangeumensis TaxID=1084526 RepID=UPI0031E9779C